MFQFLRQYHEKKIDDPKPGSTPAKVLTPTVPKASLKDAGAKFAAALNANPKTVAPAADPKAADPKTVTPAVDPSGKTPVKPGDVDPDGLFELDPADEAAATAVLKEVEAAENRAAQAEAWKSGITDGTRTYLDSEVAKLDDMDRKREAIDQQVIDTTGDPAAVVDPAADPAAAAAAAVAAGVDPAAAPAAPVEKMVPLVLGTTFRAIKNAEATDYKPEMITADYVRKFGFDPNAMPEGVAAMVTDLIRQHNVRANDSTYLHGESKKAFKARDGLKEQLFGNEFLGELRNQGFVVDAAVETMAIEARGLAMVNGKKQAWGSVIDKMQQKYPSVFRKTAGTSDGAAPAGQTPAADGTGNPDPAAAAPQTPAAPSGTRGTEQAVTPAANPASGIKTMGEARGGFAAAMRDMK